MGKIVEATAPVAGGVGAHYFFVLLDDSGQIIDQLNGFQKDAQGHLNTTGTDGGTVYVASRVDSTGMIYNESNPQTVLAQGDLTTLQSIWADGLKCGAAINDQLFTYAWSNTGGYNSNAVATTLADCMGFTLTNLTAWYQFSPGLGTHIFSWDQINSIKNDDSIEVVNIIGVPPIEAPMC